MVTWVRYRVVEIVFATFGGPWTSDCVCAVCYNPLCSVDIRLHSTLSVSPWVSPLKLRRLKYYIAEASYGMGSLFRTGGKSGGSAGGDAPISPTRMSLRSHSRVSPSNQSYDGGLGRGAPHPLVEWAIAIEDESASSTLR